MDSTIQQARKICNYYSKLRNLEITEVENQGHDNRTYRIGDKYSIRIPSHQRYISQIAKESKWIPILSKYITYKLPIAMYCGDKEPYIINHWIEGKMLADIIVDKSVARQCGEFINQLHQVKTDDSLLAGEHNFYRGGDLSIYATQAYEYINKAKSSFNEEVLKDIFRSALEVRCDDKKVFVHGDFVETNILLQPDNQIAIIDFGILGVGDPSCDLAMYWTYFNDESREIFLQETKLEKRFLVKAMGWVLWKQLLLYVDNDDKHAKSVIERIIEDYNAKI